MAQLKTPCLLLHTPADQADLDQLRHFLPSLQDGLLILQDDGGLSPFYLVNLLAAELQENRVSCGLALHTRDKNARALAGDLATAAAMNFSAFYLAEPDWNAAHAVNTMSTRDLLILARARLGEESPLIVPARLEDPADLKLLLTWQDAGADTLVLTIDKAPLPAPEGMPVLRRRWIREPGELGPGDWLSCLQR